VSSPVALDDGTRRRSSAELADRVTRWARLLHEGLGLAPGDHAALLIGNRAD
jgi:acyl-CoA synthetase (AMP-forming)/AMP-acid ligase II